MFGYLEQIELCFRCVELAGALVNCAAPLRGMTCDPHLPPGIYACSSLSLSPSLSLL